MNQNTYQQKVYAMPSREIVTSSDAGACPICAVGNAIERLV